MATKLLLGKRTDADAERRSLLAELAEEREALKRVATLVARGSPSDQVFATVTEEVGRLLPVASAGLARYESDATLSLIASWGEAIDSVPVGSRWRLGGKDIGSLVFGTRRPARMDNHAEASGPLSAAVGRMGVRSTVGVPIIVEGCLWGVMAVGSTEKQPLPVETETRLASFTELVAMAIASTESRTQLEMSRARIIAAADEARRRIQRDLHDGTQQQLISLVLELRAAEAKKPADMRELQAHLRRTAQALDVALEELREISHGIHPGILSQAGLGSALKTLARRSAVPVELELRLERRPPGHIEIAAYYVACEALANAAKHSGASVVNIELDTRGFDLKLSVRDNGIGGADLSQGTGLVGLTDRVEALGGRLEITSPAGGGTSLSLEIPVESQTRAPLFQPSRRLSTLTSRRAGISPKNVGSVEVVRRPGIDGPGRSCLAAATTAASTRRDG
jgi:signal transduction histidine kinase